MRDAPSSAYSHLCVSLPPSRSTPNTRCLLHQRDGVLPAVSGGTSLHSEVTPVTGHISSRVGSFPLLNNKPLTTLGSFPLYTEVESKPWSLTVQATEFRLSRCQLIQRQGEKAPAIQPNQDGRPLCWKLVLFKNHR